MVYSERTRSKKCRCDAVRADSSSNLSGDEDRQRCQHFRAWVRTQTERQRITERIMQKTGKCACQILFNKTYYPPMPSKKDVRRDLGSTTSVYMKAKNKHKNKHVKANYLEHIPSIFLDSSYTESEPDFYGLGIGRKNAAAKDFSESIRRQKRRKRSTKMSCGCILAANKCPAKEQMSVCCRTYSPAFQDWKTRNIKRQSRLDNLVKKFNCDENKCKSSPPEVEDLKVSGHSLLPLEAVKARNLSILFHRNDGTATDPIDIAECNFNFEKYKTDFDADRHENVSEKELELEDGLNSIISGY